MSVFKNKKTEKYMYRFKYRGQWYQQKGFRLKTDANTAEWDKRTELKEKEKIPSISLHSLMTSYLKEHELRTQRNTFRQTRKVLKAFLDFTGDIQIIDVSPNNVRSYLREQVKKRGPKAANRDLRNIKAMFNFALNNWDMRQMITHNPTTGIDKFAEDPVVRYIPPAEDIAKVRLVGGRDETDFINTIYFLGARRGEILRMTWEDVNFEKGWIRLWTRKRRGGQLEEDRLALKGHLYKILRDRWKRRDKENPHLFSFNRKELRIMMSELCKKAGVKAFGFHAIRHHVASRLNDSKKLSMKQIQLFLRHKRQTTTENYLHVLAHGVDEAADVLEENLEVVPRVVPDTRLTDEIEAGNEG